MESIQSFHNFSPLVALGGFLFALASYLWVLRHNSGEKDKRPYAQEMIRYAEQIASGSQAFLKKEYTVLLVLLTVITAVIGSQLGHESAMAYIIGALTSMFCGFVGIAAATKANIRTAWAALDGQTKQSFSISYHAASVMGMTVASLGLLGVFLTFHFLTDTTLEPLVSFAMGASTVALVTRVGGGIYTKAADVGADLVGRTELGIDEDDARNPAAIVDHVGDNVGDTAGMGADIFESYCGSIIATMLIGSTLPSGQTSAILLPLIITTMGLLASVLSIAAMGPLKSIGLSHALRVAPFLSLALLFSGSYYVVGAMDFNDAFTNPQGPFFAMIIGAFIGLLTGLSSEYYTSPDGPPVKRIAYASKTGSATNILTGVAMGMYSCIAPVLLICLGIFLSHYFSGLYGIGMAAVGMLSTIGITLSIDAQRPIVDNARGIAKMAGLESQIIGQTEKLTGIVTKTATIGKGFAVGSAAFTALALFAAYATATGLETMSLIDPKVVIGLFLGGTLPFFVAATTTNAVGHAAQKMVHEVRRQFKIHPDMLKKNDSARSDRCVKIATMASLQQMMKPGLVAIILPVAIGYLLGKEALAGTLAGVTVCGVILSMFLTNVGGAWDSAKKSIESGKIIGERKGGKAHRAAIVGDMVGDPFKDAAGPALNILVKLVAIVALVIAPLLA